MTVQQDVGKRLRRFLIATILMLVCGIAALGHLATALKARGAHAHDLQRQ